MRAAVFTLCFSLLLGGPLLGVATAQQGNVNAGAKLHQQECVRCHGPAGQGDGTAAKLLKVKPADWTDPGRMNRVSDEQLLKVIKQGGQAAGLSSQMPPFGSKFNDGNIRDLVAFIRSVCDETPVGP